MKNIIFILSIFILISCHPFMYDEPKPEYNVQVINPFSEINIETKYNIVLENISNQIIIEINYNINGLEITIIDDIVPKQKISLYGRYDKDIICTITGVITY